jgi:hypothetical protein
MFRGLAVLFGLIFIGFGILGFLPKTSSSDMFFGIFYDNPIHNVIHLLVGVIALWAAFTSAKASKLYFLIFGLIYLAVGILGFFYGESKILGMLVNNMADAWLHIILGVLFLYFVMRIKTNPTVQS